MSPTETRIVEYVREHLGCRPPEIQKALDLPRGTVSGTLSALRRAKAVVSEDGAYRVAGAPAPEVEPAPNPEPEWAYTTRSGSGGEIQAVATHRSGHVIRSTWWRVHDGSAQAELGERVRAWERAQAAEAAKDDPPRRPECCSCHLGAPCAYCTDVRAECEGCGEEFEREEPEDERCEDCAPEGAEAPADSLLIPQLLDAKEELAAHRNMNRALEAERDEAAKLARRAADELALARAAVGAIAGETLADAAARLRTRAEQAERDRANQAARATQAEAVLRTVGNALGVPNDVPTEELPHRIAQRMLRIRGYLQAGDEEPLETAASRLRKDADRQASALTTVAEHLGVDPNQAAMTLAVRKLLEERNEASRELDEAGAFVDGTLATRIRAMVADANAQENEHEAERQRITAALGLDSAATVDQILDEIGERRDVHDVLDRLDTEVGAAWARFEALRDVAKRLRQPAGVRRVG